MRRLVPVVLLASCFRPSVEECLNTCGASGHCPPGLECRADGFCVEPGSSVTCGGSGQDGAGGGDAPAGDGADSMCGFSAWPPSHFDACAVALWDDWTINGTLDYDTATGVAAGSPVGMVMEQSPVGPTMIRVVRVGMLHVQLGGTLRILGDVPLVIQADTVIVDGAIEVGQPQATSSTCMAAEVGGDGNACGEGGAGGAFGDTGGAGGNCPSSTSASVITPASGEATLTLLMTGCPGGNSGGPGTLDRPGALGGGALQISAATSLTVTGTISAPGAGGVGGVTATSATSGGSGGGSGGAIFLEAPTIVVTGSAAVCANGGGGGEGATLNPARVSGAPGSPGTCALSAAQGGNGINGGDGGGGGYAPTPLGQPGLDPAVTEASGGGGGGSVGRIRLHAASTPTLDGVITPAPAM